MADFDKISINGTYYNVKDTAAQQQIAEETRTREAADTAISRQIDNVKTALTDFYSATELGFVGDGVTDNSPILQQAISDGVTAIRFPIGSYYFSAFDISAHNMAFSGARPCSFYSDPESQKMTYFIFGATAIYDNAADCWSASRSHSFTNIGIVAKSVKQYAAFNYMKECLFYGCLFAKFSDMCIGSSHIGTFVQCMWRNMGTAFGSFHDFYVVSSYIAYNDRNVYMTSGGGGGGGFTACKIEGSEQDNIRLDGANNMNITGCLIDYAKNNNVTLQNCKNVVMSGCNLQNGLVHNLYARNCQDLNIQAVSYFDGLEIPTNSLTVLDGVQDSIFNLSFDIDEQYLQDNGIYTVKFDTPCPGTKIVSTGGNTNTAAVQFKDTYSYYPGGFYPHQAICSHVLIAKNDNTWFEGVLTGNREYIGLQKISGTLDCSLNSQDANGKVTLSCSGTCMIIHS